MALICLVGGAGHLSPSARAQEGGGTVGPPAVQHNLLLLPSAQEGRRKVAGSASIVWDQQPLRSGLRDLGKTHGISIWLDRRVDPSQRLDVRPPTAPTGSSRTLLVCLQLIAEQAGAEASLIENVVYIGPPGVGQRLQYCAVRLHDQWTAQAARTQPDVQPLAWSELTTPDALMQSIAREKSTTVSGSLPHDLMHAGSLAAPCTLATQVTLVAGGFDRCLVLSPVGELELRELSNKPMLRWSADYARQQLDGEVLDSRSSLRRLATRFQGSLRATAGQYRVTGPTEFHLALLMRVPARPATTDLEATAWKLVELQRKPVKLVLEQVAAQVGAQVSWAESVSAEQKQTLVTLTLSDVGLDELLQAVCAAADLTFRRQGRNIVVGPGE